MKILPVLTKEEMWEYLLVQGGIDNFPHFLLAPFMSWHYYDVILTKNVDDYAGLSTYIGYIETSRILSRTRKGLL